MKLTISRSLHPCLDKCYKWPFRETPVTLWQSHQPENISPVSELTNIRLPPIPDLSLITTQPDTHQKILAIRQKSLEGKRLPHLTDAEVSVLAGSSDLEGPLWKAALTAKRINRKKSNALSLFTSEAQQCKNPHQAREPDGVWWMPC